MIILSADLSFDDYVASLGRLTVHVDPTAASPANAEVKAAAESLSALEEVTGASVAGWTKAHPEWLSILGLAVGLSQERLKNTVKHHFDTAGLATLARERADEVVSLLDEEFDLVRLIRVQRHRVYDFGDVLVARASTRSTAATAGKAGRRVEDEIEAIANDLGLTCETRTRFAGRKGRTTPCDLVIPDAAHAQIAVAAKGFDSTGSKLTDAVREIEEMADARLPKQFVLAVIDGIGWKSRKGDLRRIYALWENDSIDGMYTLASLDRFRKDLAHAARLRELI